MTSIRKRIRFRVAVRGASEVDGNVDWEARENLIGDLGPVGGQRVDIIRSATSAQPWSVTLVDLDEVITSRLATAAGRYDLLRRLCDLSYQESVDGAAWTDWAPLATARIDSTDRPIPSEYRFSCQDERLVERTTTIFRGQNTTRISPEGLAAPWAEFKPNPAGRYAVVDVDAVNNVTTYDLTGYQRPALRGGGWVREDALNDLLEDDVLPNPGPWTGNFRLLRANINGTDREVALFNDGPYVDPLRRVRNEIEGEPSQEGYRPLKTFRVAGYQDPGGAGTVRDVYFHMPGHDPTDILPLHIGGVGGVDPFAFVKAIYDGGYQGVENPVTVRYDSEAFSAYHPTTNPFGLIGHPEFPKMHFRELGPANMGKWLEENIYGPLGVTPFINPAGEISPRITRMPAADQVPDIDELFVFDDSNLTFFE